MSESKKFCFACQVAKPVESMELIKTTSGQKRWKCAVCVNRASVSKYQSKAKRELNDK